MKYLSQPYASGCVGGCARESMCVCVSASMYNMHTYSMDPCIYVNVQGSMHTSIQECLHPCRARSQKALKFQSRDFWLEIEPKVFAPPREFCATTFVPQYQK